MLFFCQESFSIYLFIYHYATVSVHSQIIITMQRVCVCVLTKSKNRNDYNVVASSSRILHTVVTDTIYDIDGDGCAVKCLISRVFIYICIRCCLSDGSWHFFFARLRLVTTNCCCLPFRRFLRGLLIQEINNKQRLLAKSTEVWRLGIFIWVCMYCMYTLYACCVSYIFNTICF